MFLDPIRAVVREPQQPIIGVLDNSLHPLLRSNTLPPNPLIHHPLQTLPPLNRPNLRHAPVARKGRERVLVDALRDGVLRADARDERVAGRVLAARARARVRLDEQRVCLVVPAVVPRARRRPGADAVQVRGELCVGVRFWERCGGGGGEGVGEVLEAECEEGVVDRLEDSVVLG